ncbi:hypothetical protein CS063_04505 [Sporanaerobium hydrogeniformans]|uniref:Uncharacterized protein n=1 Tax=Sporanaerobium hydrogeniformans TaxID=3072179 RepID=A0AC61DFN6_9FIRM|nr:glycosyl hydrolase [Sporanaerobium hydrogeniformans]PHV71823.1 hypothetical protein CS063_04505 [Sporanaerobium hydrogeniformans]
MRKRIPLWMILVLVVGCLSQVGCSSHMPQEEQAVRILEEEKKQVAVEVYIKEIIPLQKMEPLKGTYLGIYEPEKPINQNTKSLEDLAGFHPVFEVMSYTLEEGLPVRGFLRCIAEDKIPYIKIAYSKKGDLTALYRLIMNLKEEYDLPVFIELFPVQQSVNDSVTYKQAYRRGYDLLKKYIKHAVVVWSIEDSRIYDMPLYYPGDDVVDWAGLNVYIPRYKNGASYTFNYAQDMDFWYKSFQKTKPMLLSSLAISQFSRVDHTYDLRSVQNNLDFFYKEIPLMYPRLKGILYIDVDMAAINERGMENYRLSNQKELTEHLKNLLKQSLFVQKVGDEVQGLKQEQYMKYSIEATEIEGKLYLPKKLAVTLFKDFPASFCKMKEDEKGDKYYLLEDIKLYTDMYYESKSQE